MPKIWTVGLRNDETTRVNLEIALDNNLWGMTTAGKHVDIRKGDYVLFIVGLSIDNKDEFNDGNLLKGFPLLKNASLHEVTSLLKCKIDTAYFGQITTDYFVDEAKVWEPKINLNTDSKNYFHNRFGWEHTHIQTDLIISKNEISEELYTGILKSLRSKKVEPSRVTYIEEITRLLTPYAGQTEEDYQDSFDLSVEAEIPAGAVPKKKKKNTVQGSTWTRSPTIKSKSLIKANYLCENDEMHTTFISQKTQKPFMEAHHLIPMEYQDEFEVSIDVPENILSLCPNCHRAFHSSEYNQRESLVRKFFEKRSSDLESREITIGIDGLLRFYVNI